MADRMFATGNRISGCKALITLGDTVEVAKRLSKSQKFVCWIGAMELLLTEANQEEEINKIQENFLHSMITLDWVEKVEDYVKTKIQALEDFFDKYHDIIFPTFCKASRSYLQFVGN